MADYEANFEYIPTEPVVADFEILPQVQANFELKYYVEQDVQKMIYNYLFNETSWEKKQGETQYSFEIDLTEHLLYRITLSDVLLLEDGVYRNALYEYSIQGNVLTLYSDEPVVGKAVIIGDYII